MAPFQPSTETIVVIGPLEMFEVMKRRRRGFGQSVEGRLSPQKPQKLHRLTHSSVEGVLGFGPRSESVDQWHIAAYRKPENAHDVHATRQLPGLTSGELIGPPLVARGPAEWRRIRRDVETDWTSLANPRA
jgi:hypothetical protein